MRLFFAVLISEDVREALGRVQQQVRSLVGEDGVRWVAPELFHFTLKFLGETAEARLAPAVAAAREAAGRVAPFDLEIARVGAMPSARRPQVIYSSAGGGFPHLRALAEYLNGALETHGFAGETRPFHAHLTLARIKSPAGAKAVSSLFAKQSDALKDVDRIGVFRVYECVLMSSVLRPQGPEYSVVERFVLGGMREEG